MPWWIEAGVCRRRVSTDPKTTERGQNSADGDKGYETGTRPCNVSARYPMIATRSFDWSSSGSSAASLDLSFRQVGGLKRRGIGTEFTHRCPTEGAEGSMGRWRQSLVCVGVAAAVGIALSGCGADDGQDAVGPTSSAESLRSALCQGSSRRIGCLYVTNHAQVFTAPNTLGAAAYGYVGWNRIWGEDKPDWDWVPSWTWEIPGQDAMLNKVESNGAGVEGNVYYRPPTPLPQNDVVNMYYKDPLDAANDVGCPPAKFTSCRYAMDNDDKDHTWFSYEIENYPFTVAITNNLSAAKNDQLTLVGQPAVNGFVVDPIGGNPATVTTGNTGYFGMYQPAPGAGLGISGFAATYKVSDQSTDLAGGSFSVNIAIDSDTGVLDPSAACGFIPGARSQTAYCDLVLQGAPGGPQTVVIDIHT